MTKRTPRPCEVCTTEYVPVRIDQRTCSSECGAWMTRHLNPRACSVEGCERPHLARGLCGTHYNRKHAPDRHKKVATDCSVCGEVVMKHPTSRRRPVCSDRCRYVLRFGRFRHEGRELVGPLDIAPLPPSPKPARFTKPSVSIVQSTSRGFISGGCSHCGEVFTHRRGRGSDARYCSKRCARRAASARAKAKRGEFSISDVARKAIYKRDNWTCQLCFESVEPHADPASDWFPSLDHIVPQSHALIPDHSPTNLRTCHRWCNSVRGDERRYTSADFLPA